MGSNRPLRPVANDGSLVDATFEVHAAAVLHLVYHHKAGGRNSPRSVNADYNKGLELLLERLATRRFKILSIAVDSRVAHELDPVDRELKLSYPILLNPSVDIPALRLDIGRAQKPIGRRADVKPGSDGNSQKRIKITLACDDPSLNHTELVDLLVGPVVEERGSERPSTTMPDLSWVAQSIGTVEQERSLGTKSKQR